MKALSTILLVVLTANGCASVHHIRNAEDASVAYTEINRLAERKSAKVTLTSGQTNRAQDLQISPDSSAWLDPASGQRLRFATEDLHQVQFRNQLSGALTAFGIGALAGAMLGTGVMRGDGYDWGASLSIGATLAPLTGLTAAIIGSVVGNREVYRFPAKW